MTTEEYTKYIVNYFENSKTGGALMLTSSWGRGKSFYIDKSLVESKKLKGRCVKVSLYGLKSVEDISKAIYLEIRAKKLRNQKNESLSVLALAGRTVARGILSYFRISLEPQQDELHNLYNSIDLSEKFIILEDVERSSIPIVDIMGYVNNLCEQDGLKVLLVANEDVIKAGTDADEYRRIKEKTVSDTIVFDCPIDIPIENILDSFSADNNCFEKFLVQKNDDNERIAVKEIKDIMQDDAKLNESSGYNLRSLIFACQKTEDLFREATNNGIAVESYFFDACFYGIIAFSLKLKRGRKHDQTPLRWENDLDSPAILGSHKHPLLKVCYDFIREQKFDPEIFEKTVIDYPKLKKKEESWRNLKDYLSYSFNDLTATIEEIRELVDEGSFPLEEYGTLANRLFSIKATLGESDAITSLLASIKSKLASATFHPYEVYDRIINLSASERLHNVEYEVFQKELSQIIVNKAVEDFVALTVTKGGISQFPRLIDLYESWSRDLFNSIRMEFASKLDVEKLADSLAACSSRTVKEFADSFLLIYNVRNKESSSSGKATYTSKEKTINELFEALPKQFKNGLADSSYISLEDKESLRKFKEAFERKYDSLTTENLYLENEKDSIDKLIVCLEKKVEDSQIDIILKYQLADFANKLKHRFH